MYAGSSAPPPRVLRVRRCFGTPALDDVQGEVARALAGFSLPEKVRPGQRVAIAAGSRGVTDIVPVLRTIVTALRACGCEPFVVPGMGSHGGATAQGQAAVLASIGVTEAVVGAPVVSSLATTVVATSRFGSPVHVGTDFLQADHVVVLNRVKPHTDFSGHIESGLVKMMVIGMGKHAGAETAHRLTIRHGFPDVLGDFAQRVLSAVPVLCGVAVLENEHEETAAVEVLAADQIIAREPELLVRARAMMPLLPFDQLDVLVVDELGKDVSGNGMDTNVIGRISFCGSPQPKSPRITRIFVRGLTAATHGNASGIGMADFTTTRLIRAIDRESTQVNCLTANTPEDARLPVAYDIDRLAVQACLATCGVTDTRTARLAWVRSTRALDRLVVSSALREDVARHAELKVVGEETELPFDENGDLVADWRY